MKKQTENLLPLLKLIADESRLVILLLLKQKNCCVSELIKLSGLSQSLISHHLKDIKDGGLVDSQKQGKWVYYFLTEKGKKVLSILENISP